MDAHLHRKLSKRSSQQKRTEKQVKGRWVYDLWGYKEKAKKTPLYAEPRK